jgi:RHS repeat-associated protein
LQHEPLTDTDTAGQVTTFTYNGSGQMLTRENAKHEITTFGYGGTVPNGYLASITSPAFNGSSAVTSFAYDSFNRIRTATDSDGYAVTTDYDNLDRETKITYPDGTYQQFQYTDNVTGAMTLDLTGSRDRRGLWTYRHYNANRQMDSMTEFTYDGLSRCVKIVEKTGNTVNSTRKFVWCGAEQCEFRNANGAVQLQLYPQGQYQSGAAYFYTRDHLGSIREMTNTSGTVVARYDYDPYGRSTTVIGTNKPDFNFTGLYQHAKSGLDMAVYRFYDPDLGRWLSRDPIGEAGGLNLYGYVSNNPVNLIDPDGLLQQPYVLAPPASVGGAGVGAVAGWAGAGAVIGAAIGYPLGQIDVPAWSPNYKVCDVAADSLVEGAQWWKTVLWAAASWWATHTGGGPVEELGGLPGTHNQGPPRSPTEIRQPGGATPSPSPMFPIPVPTPRG